ncbi:DNA polymerase subunit Cdc27 [Mycena maculata]|uniref:DNA polymerase delta subunit 3 n=1 Tax=Mycena maculata TaxID=230809 RepID=A0AAD7NYB2_9AGAR|nr:DNA polymerase subunit Cdc27 [Mycena maculata]
MSTQPVRDYLTKQLLIENNIVTYRSLSRALTLNVNAAKNELADFHANDGEKLAATYLLSGRIQPASNHSEDVDMDDGESEGFEAEDVDCTEMLLVGERELESAQAQFIELESIHIYSLSPAVIRDAGLLCTPTEIVRNLDHKKGAELAAAVGKVIASNVTVSTKALPSWGGRKAPPPVAGPSKVAASTSAVKKEEDAKHKEKAKPEKPKATGKLDFSKAKTKPLKKEEDKPVKPETKPEVATTIGEKVQAKVAESKRGVKRKSALASDSEEEEKVVVKPAKPAVKDQSSVRVRKGVILSDDEDDVPAAAAARKGKGKATAAASEAEKNLRAMMDIDDNAVTRASRDTPAEPDEEPDTDMATTDVNMSDGESKPAPVKRKPKKVVPIGKNGLKKKRVVKSKMHLDEKGYMVSQDYSEYESVEEEEEEEEPAPKGKGKGKAKAKVVEDSAPTKAKTAAKPAPPAKTKPKPGGSSKPGQQAGLASFFGKSKSK